MTAWLLTYWVHSALLLGLGWVVARCLGDRRLEAQELMLRLALVGGLVTATLQPVLGWGPPLRWPGPAVERAASGLAPRVKAPLGGETAAGGHEPASGSRLGEGVPARVSGHAAAADPGSARWAQTLGDRMTALWGLGALLLGLHLAVGYVLTRHRLRCRQPVRAGRLHALFRGLLRGERRGAGFGLAQSERIAVPIAHGILRPEVCVPARLTRQLPEEQQELVLAHEACHLLRRDPAWLALYRLIEAALFVQPLHRPVVRRLVEIAELRCDDWAVRRTGRPIALAKCLTEVASWGRGRRGMALAPTMAGSRGLKARVERLLRSEDPRAGQPPSWAWVAAAVGVLLVVALAAPRVAPAGEPGEGAPPAAEASESVPQVAPAPEAPPAPPSPAPAVATATPVAATARRVGPAGPAGWVRGSPPPATRSGPVEVVRLDGPLTEADRELGAVEEIWDQLADDTDRALDHREEALEGFEESLARAEEELERQLEGLLDDLEEVEDRIDRRTERSGEMSRRSALERRSGEIRQALEGLEEALDGQAERIEDHLELEIEGHLRVAGEWVEREAAERERTLAELAARRRREVERLRTEVGERSRREAERLERALEVELRRMERALTPALDSELGAEIDALRRTFERRLEEQRRALEQLRSQLAEPGSRN